MSVVVFIFFILLIDAIFVNLLAWFGKDTKKWYMSHIGLAHHFPLARGWTAYYLILVLFIGYLLHNFGALGLLFGG